MTHATRRPLNTNTLRNIEQVLNFLKAMCRPHAYDTDHTDFQSGKLRFAPATSSRHTTGASRTELEDMFGITRWESYVVLSHLQKANLIRQQKHGQHVAYCWQSLAEFVDRGNDPQDWDSGDTRLRGDYGPAFEVPHPLCQWHHDEIVISCDKVGNEYRWHYFHKNFSIKHPDGIEPLDCSGDSDPITQAALQSARPDQQDDARQPPQPPQAEEGIPLEELDEELLDDATDELNAAADDWHRIIESALQGNWSHLQSFIAAGKPTP